MIGLVWAQAANGVIGRGNALPWHLPEDLAHFRELTRGTTVVMGRRTWESLPPRFRPLPDRFNIVLSRDATWTADGAVRASDFPDALTLAASSTVEADVWVIGGASVYALAIPFADTLVVTELREGFDGDVHAAPIEDGWRLSEAAGADEWLTSETGLHYRFRRYLRS